MNQDDRFWSKVDIRGDNECWPWVAKSTAGGRTAAYGYFRTNDPRSNVYAHRYAYCYYHRIHWTALPSHVVIRHKCDNTLCCNPRHLKKGTQLQNIQDTVSRGRVARGSKLGKLTERNVKRIKRRLARGEYHHSIAADYGVSRATISQINRGASWDWL